MIDLSHLMTSPKALIIQAISIGLAERLSYVDVGLSIAVHITGLATFCFFLLFNRKKIKERSIELWHEIFPIKPPEK